MTYLVLSSNSEIIPVSAALKLVKIIFDYINYTNGVCDNDIIAQKLSQSPYRDLVPLH
jgi:hypothetical protein